MFILGVQSSAMHTQSVQGGYAKCAGEIAVTAAAELTVIKFQTKLSSNLFGDLVQRQGPFVRLEERPHRSSLYFDPDLGVRRYQ